MGGVLLHFVGGHSHFHPLVPLARAVRAAGARTAFAASADRRSMVEQAGFEFLALPAARLSRGGAAPPSAAEARGRAVEAFRDYLRAGEELAPALAEVAVRWGAGVLVRETAAWAGWLAAGLTGLPGVLLDYAPTPPRLMTDLLGPDLDAARQRLGLPPDRGSVHGGLHILAAPPGWYPRSCSGPRTRLHRPPVVPPRPVEQASEWFQAIRGERYAYLTLGSMYHATPRVLEAMVAACAAAGVRAVASTGPGSGAGTGPGVTVTGFMPQDLESLVVANAAAVVAHAGYGTLMTAFTHGKPVVCVPLGGADNSMRATQLAGTGAGVVLDAGETSAEVIAAALRAVLREDGYRARAAALAAGTAALPPLEAAAADVLALIGVPA